MYAKKVVLPKRLPLKKEKNCKAFQGPSFFNSPDVDVQDAKKYMLTLLKEESKIKGFSKAIFRTNVNATIYRLL